MPKSTPIDLPTYWHFSPRMFDEWTDELRPRISDEKQQRAFAHCCDGVQRLLFKQAQLEGFRKSLPSVNAAEVRSRLGLAEGEDAFGLFDSKVMGVRDLTPQEQHFLFSETEAFFVSFYPTLSAVAGLVVRFSSVFGLYGAPKNMTTFIKWLSNRYPHIPFEFFEEARNFRTWLDHPDQKPPYSWGTAQGSTPVHIFLHGTIIENRFPEGTSQNEKHSIPGQWSLSAPDEAWVVNVLGLTLLHLFSEIGMLNPPAYITYEAGPSVGQDAHYLYIPEKRIKRW
jgi:hypothetical protein